MEQNRNLGSQQGNQRSGQQQEQYGNQSSRDMERGSLGGQQEISNDRSQQDRSSSHTQRSQEPGSLRSTSTSEESESGTL